MSPEAVKCIEVLPGLGNALNHISVRRGVAAQDDPQVFGMVNLLDGSAICEVDRAAGGRGSQQHTLLDIQPEVAVSSCGLNRMEKLFGFGGSARHESSVVSKRQIVERLVLAVKPWQILPVRCDGNVHVVHDHAVHNEEQVRGQRAPLPDT